MTVHLSVPIDKQNPIVKIYTIEKKSLKTKICFWFICMEIHFVFNVVFWIFNFIRDHQTESIFLNTRNSGLCFLIPLESNRIGSRMKRSIWHFEWFFFCIRCEYERLTVWLQISENFFVLAHNLLDFA